MTCGKLGNMLLRSLTKNLLLSCRGCHHWTPQWSAPQCQPQLQRATLLRGTPFLEQHKYILFYLSQKRVLEAICIHINQTKIFIYTLLQK